MNNFLPAKKPAPSFLANSPRKNKDARPDKRPTQGASRTPPTRVGARRTLRDVRQRMWLPTPTNGARAVPAGSNTWGDGRRRERRGKRGYSWSCRTDASNAARRSHDRGASRTPPLTGGSETNVAAWNVTDIENLTQTARQPHGSAETYPIATTVGGGVLDAPSVG